MKTAVLILLLVCASKVALAGTGKSLDFSEQKVVADELSKVIPSMLSGAGGELDSCILSNAQPQGRRSKLEVACEFTSPAGFVGEARFDHVKIDAKQKVIAARFKSLDRP